MKNTGMEQLRVNQISQVIAAAEDLRNCARSPVHEHKGFGWRLQVVAQAIERVCDHVERLQQIEFDINQSEGNDDA